MISTQEWKAWVEGVKVQREGVYTQDPDELVGAYYREVGYTRDYHGRELFELLQNADDAGANGGRKQRSIIMLREEGLCFANTGEPFTKDGIKSLMISDNSAKKRNASRYIGNRGLGFRSILGWTDCPFILSGNLSIGFDKARAGRWLEALARMDKGVRLRIEKEAQSTSEAPIPTLAIPAWIDRQDYDSCFVTDSPNIASVWQLAQGLRAEGYDTVVALPFTRQSAFSKARAQLGQLGREVLLFLRSVQELVIDKPEGKVSWIAHGHDARVEVTSDEPTWSPQVWDIYTSTGTIPEGMLREDQRGTPDYEFKLAVPSDDTIVPGTLFNFFPTKVQFPFPLIAHATLELTNNRQNIAESEANTFLLKRLSRFMAETAERVAGDVANPWRALSLVAPRGDLDKDVRDLGFDEALREEAMRRRIIPVRDGRKLSAREARRLSISEASWLPTRGFEDVVASTTDRWLVKMVDHLETSALTKSELRKRLSYSSSALSISDRAALIAGLIKARIMPSSPAPSLLTDSVDRLIKEETAPFFPPGRGTAFDIPSRYGVKLVNERLVEALRIEIGVATVTQLVGYLSAFGVQEYSLREVARSVIRATNQDANEHPEMEADYRLGGLLTLYKLYGQGSASDDRDTSRRQIDIRVRVPNRDGHFANADSLYLGNWYPGGRLTEAFYGRHFSEKMVASPEELRLPGTAAEIGEFLTWLGVASQPRLQRLNSSLDEGFYDQVRASLRYPAVFEDNIEFRNSEDLPRFGITGVAWVDGLDKLLQEPDPHAIVAWLAADSRIGGWLSDTDEGAKLSVRPQGKTKARALKGQTLPSYVMWLLRRKEWVPISDGGFRAPGSCTLAANLPKKARAVLPSPVLHESDELFQSLGIDQRSIHAALARAGVPIYLDDMSWDDFYDLLLRLPDLDPVGEFARATYRVLAERTDAGGAQESPLRKRFESEGMLWVRRSGVAGYHHVRDGIYYEDDTTMPEVVARKLPILDLDRRRGAQKMRRLFGVQPLSSLPIDVEIREVERHPRWEGLNREVKRLKPYAYAMRLHSDENAEGLSRLRHLDIILCHSASGLVLMGDGESEIGVSLSSGDRISVSKGAQARDGEEVYLCVGTGESLDGRRLLSDDIAYDVGDVLARLLNVENTGNFVSLAECSPARREGRLRRMLGADPTELLEEARHKLRVGPEEPILERDRKERYVPPVEGKPADVSGTGTGEPGEEGEVPGEQRGGPVGPVEAQEKPHEPDAERGKVRKRVSATRSSGKLRVGSYQITGSDRCEELARRFEEAHGQERFPLRVGHGTGYGFYGCDLLSFATEEDRETFKQQEDPDMSLVLRFIEVKGRKTEKGSITLEGNELNAAEDYPDRFYLYRVFEGDEAFELAVLRNPLAGGVSVKYEVDLFRQANLETFEVMEVESPQNASIH